MRTKEEKNAYRRQWAQDNPEKQRLQQKKNNLFQRFGIRLPEYLELLQKQNGVCAICFQPEIFREGNSRQLKALTVDHDHKTGQIRGLLCHRCNLGLGHFRDDIDFMANAVQYVRSHRTKVQS